MTRTYELAASYLKGWQHAAACKAMDQRFLDNPDSPLSAAYDAGYTSGTKARRAAIKEAEEKYDHKFSTLKPMEEPRPRLWQHEDTGRRCWAAESPGEHWRPVSLCYEYQLPAGISDKEYSDWFIESMVIDGARMGPALNPHG